MEDQGQQVSNAELVERLTSRLANSLVIAAGVIGLGLYASGDDYETEAQTYQAIPTTDGRVVRLNTDSGSIVSCDAAQCTLVYRGDERLPRVGETPGRKEAGEGAQPAAPAQPALPAAGAAPQAPQAGTAPQPPQAGAVPEPQSAPAQPQR